MDGWNGSLFLEGEKNLLGDALIKSVYIYIYNIYYIYIYVYMYMNIYINIYVYGDQKYPHKKCAHRKIALFFLELRISTRAKRAKSQNNVAA